MVSPSVVRTVAESDAAAGRLRVVTPDGAVSKTGWDRAYREHVVNVYRFIYARCGNRPDAEDLTAQVFLRALPRLDDGAPLPQQRSYLLTTARTVLADHWSAQYAARSTVLEDNIPSLEAEADPELIERGVEIDSLLAPLPPHYRTVLELRFLRGYSVRETAAEMDISVANAKVLQLRALRAAARCAPGDIDE